MTIEENFNKDLLWMLSELKQEDLANVYSEYKFEFFVHQKTDKEPSERSQYRILKLLSGMKAITLSPIFARGYLSALSSVFEMQGASPIGYTVGIVQPKFNELCEEITKQKFLNITKINTDKVEPRSADKNEYFISINRKCVVLNNTFILSSPNFNSENANFIEYMIANPNKKLSKADVEKGMKTDLKKSFHQIVDDLGFRGEVRKIFFDVSKTAVKFMNRVPQKELSNLGVDEITLATELSGLSGINQKQIETKSKDQKQ